MVPVQHYFAMFYRGPQSLLARRGVSILCVLQLVAVLHCGQHLQETIIPGQVRQCYPSVLLSCFAMHGFLEYVHVGIALARPAYNIVMGTNHE